MDISLLKSLEKLVPPEALLLSAEECAPYATDWTKIPGKPSAVVLPRTTDEVARVLRSCSEFGVPVVPSGGRTGLAGGAVATRGEIVLNLSRMNRLGEVNELARTVRVGAGAVTQEVHRHCETAGLTWPIDLASKGSCQIGGNLSTNAGGLRVIRYGMARKWVSSLEVVTASGQVLELNADLEKNNTGYDLLQLIVGSEGTLAVITGATLKLVKVPPDRGKSVCLFAVSDLKGLPYLFERFRRGPFEILAFEFFSEKCLGAVKEKLGHRCRLEKRGTYYVLAEIAGEDPREHWFSQVLSSPLVADAMQAESSAGQQELWALREGITESLALTAPLRKHDLSVPVQYVDKFLKEVETAAAGMNAGIDLYFFGHFGDGSPHVNLLCPKGIPAETFHANCDRFEPRLFSILHKYRGSISSEHGIGLLKKKWLGFSRTPVEMEIFRTIKRALDPNGLLNPGKIFD